MSERRSSRRRRPRGPAVKYTWPARPRPEPVWRRPPPAPWVRRPAAAPEAGEPAGRSLHDILWDSGLLNVLTLAARDLAGLLLSPAACVAGALVIVPVGVLGYLLQINSGQPLTMTSVFRWTAVAMAFLTPLGTMRLLAGERRAGTLELLLASPVRLWELVLGKWLAGMLCLLAATAFTVVYAVLIAVHQPAVDYGALAAGYLGLALVAAAWVALGLLASSLTGNRIAAAAGGLALLLALLVLPGPLAGALSPPLSDLVEYVSAANRAQSFESGQLALRDVVYFLSLTAGALLLATRAVRWRRGR